MSEGPLNGTTVVEFGNLIAGPYAGMLLADLGARVVKVEPPGGDLGRRFGPFQNGESAFFMAVNRGKESLALDTKDPRAREALDTLVRRADALIHNLRLGAMDRLGLGIDRAVDLNPSIVYVTVSAFGSEGPYAERPGIDVVFQGESGMISITGDEGDGPRKTATTIGDYVAGTNAALAVAAALAESPRRHRRIDVSLRDGLMAVQSGWNALHFHDGGQPPRTGTASPFLAPNRVFDASDRAFTLAIVSDQHFAALCRVLDLETLATEFPDNEARMNRRSELEAVLGRLFATRPAEHWLGLLRSAGIPCGLVLDLAEAFDDPQSQFHEMRAELDHPVAGRVTTTGSPIRIDGAPARAAGVPPVLGGDTQALLAELGFDGDTLAEMIEERAAVVHGR